MNAPAPDDQTPTHADKRPSRADLASGRTSRWLTPTAISADRQRVSSSRLWAMTLLTGAMVWAALSSLTPNGARISSETLAQASGVVAVLAIFGLRSVPVRWIVRGLALVSGLMLARFGQLGSTEGLSGSWRVMVWLGMLGAALTFAPSSRSVVVDTEPRQRGRRRTPAKRPAGGAAGSGGGTTGTTGRPARRSGSTGTAMSVAADAKGRIPAAVAIAAVSLVAGAALIVGPRASNWFPTGSRASDLVDRAMARGDNVLTSRDTLDMTSRPRLTDKVVMTVRSPIVTFWRAELFDTWDGATWSRSYGRAGNILVSGNTAPGVDDIAARAGTETRQDFRLETGFATVMPSAASPVRVQSQNQVAQRADGTLVSAYQALGSGTTYTVWSRQMSLDAQVLRAAGSARAIVGSSGGFDPGGSGEPAAAAVLAQYAKEPVTTQRVVALAREQTEGLTNDFDRVLALERWMGTHTTYSLDAPLSPKGVDVVDNFLFDQTEGWCEQIASSLVVMARAVGIPARLATGYAPGEWDAAGRRFVVRERDAHAWAEVWFPGQGWVPFDPTASVPLSGGDDARAGASARDWREILGMALVALGLVSVTAAPVARWVERAVASIRARGARRRDAHDRWEVRAERRLEDIGQSAGRPRAPADTLSAYGASVAEAVHDERLIGVGRALDRIAYGPASGLASGVAAGAASGPAADPLRARLGAMSDPEAERREIESILEDMESGR